MPLRNPNNPNTDSVLAVAFIAIAVGYPSVNTVIGSVPADVNGKGPIFYNMAFEEMAFGSFPSALLTVGPQSYQRLSRSNWVGAVTLDLDYFNRWDRQSAQIDTIRASIATDLERIKANIESNESLQQNNTAYTISAYSHTLSPYKGEQLDMDGLTLVTRRYSCSFHILPYDS